ncbi:Lsr2 family DNA-binding protein [Kitasatospora cheerisanensis]|uniref:Lsr2 DNA-binding domain-containing protein n=1 Tax=Kitasatospora cheerisanensis KCTC 2395 TaxID=1348663 RepID=A0A066YYX1_9ACTN|nr:histone-like nucleoid-structuring protein Lsr2 [Kitasatospora cheerisanensis]KDN86718.1 hypothetical protein KCH_15060 [Kitasatospora cheerisanensis KCTC 2395]
MTIAALRTLVDAELPDVQRPTAPRIRPTNRPRGGPAVDTERAIAVSMYKTGEYIATITQATGLGQDEIAAAVEEAGYKFAPDAPGDEPTDPAADTAETLIAWGMRHSSARMQRLADQARTALADLQQASRREAVVTAAEEKVHAAEQALAAARDELRAAKGAPAASGRPDRAEAAAIRAWANQHGHTVGTFGMIPAPIVAAYRAANKEASRAA